MRLYEYMAKNMLADYGIPIPKSRVVTSVDEAVETADDFGVPVVLKAQVLSGGRGKAGGIQFAETPRIAGENAQTLLASEIGGHRVETLLVEERLDIDREWYLGIIIDTASKSPVVMASAQGGVEIETVPDRNIFRATIDTKWGLFRYQMRALTTDMGISGVAARQVQTIAIALYRLFRREDALMAEINPLALCGDEVVAADARLTLDDDSRFRHRDWPDTEAFGEIGARIAELGLSYVPLAGDVAVLANGAGATMATMDALAHFGADPMNFLDVGGGADREKMGEALRLLASTDPKVILINVFGGITRCDELAQMVVDAKASGVLEAPLVIRLSGTNEDEGRDILEAAGLNAFNHLDQAARRAAELVGEGGADDNSSG